MKILFICTGNTCRSPMAEGIMNMLSREKGLDAISDSAGLFAHSGDSMSPNAALALKSLYNIDFSHLSQLVTPSLLENNDLVVTMSGAHRDILLRLTGYEGRVITMPRDIPDPFGSSAESYMFTAREIYSGLSELIDLGAFNEL